MAQCLLKLQGIRNGFGLHFWMEFINSLLNLFIFFLDERIFRYLMKQISTVNLCRSSNFSCWGFLSRFLYTRFLKIFYIAEIYSLYRNIYSYLHSWLDLCTKSQSELSRKRYGSVLYHRFIYQYLYILYVLIYIKLLRCRFLCTYPPQGLLLLGFLPWRAY